MASRSYCRRGNTLGWVVSGVLLVILFVWIVWSLGRPMTHGPEIMQRGQFHSIEVAIDMFAADSGYGNFPPSNDNSLPPVHPEDATPYGGAQKLAEALVGWDLLGYHPESDFRYDGHSVDSSGAATPVYEPSQDHSKKRKGPYIELENANAFRLGDIYEPSVLTAAGTNPDNYVLCDMYARKRHSDRKTGMPLLYYRADTSKTGHDVDNPDNPENIYSYKDNHILLGFGVPGRSKTNHPMFTDPGLFYDMTRNDEITTPSRPYCSGSYILISAGKDGLYGTDDDIRNFTKQ